MLDGDVDEDTAALERRGAPHEADRRIADADERVFSRGDYLLYTLLTIVNVAALWFALRTLFDVARIEEPSFWLALVLLLPMLFMWELRWLTLPAMKRPRPLAPPAGARVAVVTTFVPAAEPIAMLDETLRALVALDYPHDTWVLDEGEDATVKRLCRRLGVHHFSRRWLPRYNTSEGTFQTRSKHGNYNAWLHEVGFQRYDAIATFDPDHVPNRHYLTRLLGYLRDPRVAYVQAPQLYYNQDASFIARGAAEETYAYYSSTQMAGYATGFPVSVGCHTTHRIAALQQIGGLPPHDGDDLAATLIYLAHGWKGVYDPTPLAAGLTPVDWDGYLTQQRRWARSVLDLKLRLYPRLVRALPPRVRIAAGLHGLYYLSGLATPVALSYLCYLLLSGREPLASETSTLPPLLVLIAVLAGCDFYRQRFYIRRKLELGIHWRAMILRFAKWPWLVAALFDALLLRQRDYEITAKRTLATRRFATLPHALTAVVLAAAWLTGRLAGNHPSTLALTLAATVALVSVSIAATSFRTFPPPYDPALPNGMTTGRRR